MFLLASRYGNHGKEQNDRDIQTLLQGNHSLWNLNFNPGIRPFSITLASPAGGSVVAFVPVQKTQYDRLSASHASFVREGSHLAGQIFRDADLTERSRPRRDQNSGAHWQAQCCVCARTPSHLLQSAHLGMFITSNSSSA
jgi:hypothetical protein